MADVENDDNGEGGVLDEPDIKLDTQIHNGHDGAAQIDHPFDEGRGMGDGSGRLIAANLLNLENINGIFLRTKGEGEELLQSVGLLLFQGGGIGSFNCPKYLLLQAAAGWAVRAICTRAATSNIKATWPSPMMVAPEIPATLR